MESLRREDFSYTNNAEGYMIQYKGKNIGGAGILGKFSGRGRAVTKQRQDYAEDANREIRLIISGNGQARFYETIKKIDGQI